MQLPENITLALILAPGGGFLAAAIIRQLIEVIKVALPQVDARISGALLALILAGVLYLFAFAAVGVFTFEAGFAAFLAWLACATSAIGINSALDHVDRVAKAPPEDAYIPRTDGQL